MKKIRVAVLGATGVVGQQFVRMLIDHPYFELGALAASKRSVGRKFGERVNWIVSREIPSRVKEKTIIDIDIEVLRKEGINIVFSALPTTIAKKIERKLTGENIVVFSNASAHRMDNDVPILIPEVNPEHLDLIVDKYKEGNGFLITNPNCTTAGLVFGLKPLLPFGIKTVVVTTYQALSGAGYPGVSSLEALGNIIPFIENEEEKIECETKKILGSFDKRGIQDAQFEINASCTRVPIRNGHLESIVIELEKNVNIDDVKNAFRNFVGIPQEEGLPTAPRQPIILRDEENRPQPVLDLNAGDPFRSRGMAITVGRIRKRGSKVRLFLLVHNTIRGAAGTSILNAELVVNYKNIAMQID